MLMWISCGYFSLLELTDARHRHEEVEDLEPKALRFQQKVEVLIQETHPRFPFGKFENVQFLFLGK